MPSFGLQTFDFCMINSGAFNDILASKCESTELHISLKCASNISQAADSDTFPTILDWVRDFSQTLDFHVVQEFLLSPLYSEFNSESDKDFLEFNLLNLIISLYFLLSS